MSKLHIPGPDHTPKEEAFGDVELGALICAILAVSLLYYFSQSVTPDPMQGMTLAEREAAEMVKKLSRKAKAERKMAMSFDETSASVLEKHAWTTEELLAVLRFGKRETAEAACRARAGQFEAKTVSDPFRLELLKAVDRREERAPYTCLSHLFFAGKIKVYEDLEKELEEFWSEAENFEGNARLAGSVVDDFRKTRQRPESPRFFNWLRQCALNQEYEGATRCQLMLRTISPSEGADMLELVSKHLDATQERAEDIPLIIKATGHLTRNGQPPSWKVKETKALPDYDVDFRQGSLYMLCRFVFSPNREHSVLAAEQLGDVANYGARQYDDKLLKRWRYACYDAFKKSDDPDAVKVLGVWDGEEGSKPVYTLTPGKTLSRCEQKPEYPIWYCGASAWNGEGKPLDSALGDFFVDTRDIETDSWEY